MQARPLVHSFLPFLSSPSLSSLPSLTLLELLEVLELREESVQLILDVRTEQQRLKEARQRKHTKRNTARAEEGGR